VARHLLAGVALLLGGERLALGIAHGLDAGIGEGYRVEVLEVQRGDLAHVVLLALEGLSPLTPSTDETALPKPISALPVCTPTTLEMPAPGSTCTLVPGTFFSMMPWIAPPSGYHDPPCGPVMSLICCAAGGTANAAASADGKDLRDAWGFHGLLLEV
jgi:hypothetical protein